MRLKWAQYIHVFLSSFLALVATKTAELKTEFCGTTKTIVQMNMSVSYLTRNMDTTKTTVLEIQARAFAKVTQISCPINVLFECFPGCLIFF